MYNSMPEHGSDGDSGIIVFYILMILMIIYGFAIASSRPMVSQAPKLSFYSADTPHPFHLRSTIDSC